MNVFFRYPKGILFFLVATTIGLGAGLPYLRMDYSPQYVFHSQSKKFRELEKYLKVFGKEDHTLILIFQKKDILDDLTYFRQLRARLEKKKDIKTRSLLDFFPSSLPAGEFKQKVMAQFWTKKLFISEDGTTMAFLVDFNPKIEKIQGLLPLIHQVDQLLEEFPPPNMDLHITGIPYIRKQIVQKLIDDQILFIPLCTFLFLLVLYYLFRSWLLVLLPFCSIGMAIVWILGLMGWMGKSIDILNNVLPTLIFIIAISDSIHLMARYVAELKAGKSREEALQTTVSHLALACFFTSFTTAVGFGSLLIAKIDLLRAFGLYAALGVMFGYIATLLFLPLALSWFAPPPIEKLAKGGDWKMAGLARWILGNPVKLLVLSLVVVGGAGYVGHKVEVNNYLLETISRDDPLFEASVISEKKLAGIIPMAILFEAKSVEDLYRPEVFLAMDNLATFLRTQKGINYVISPSDFIKEAYFRMSSANPFLKAERKIPKDPALLKTLIKAIEKYRGTIWKKFFRPDVKQARIQGFGRDVGAKTAMESVAVLERKMAKYALPGIRISTNDIAPVAAPALQNLVKDMRDSLILAFGIIFLTMMFLFRSVKIGLVSIIPNVAPLVMAIGALGAVGLELQVTTIFVFPIALGLAVDDTIHFLTRHREAIQQGLSPGDAIIDTFAGAGKAICSTTLLLGLGYVVILFSHFPITRRFSALMEVIIWSALVGDLLLLPACLLLFKVGKKKPLAENAVEKL